MSDHVALDVGPHKQRMLDEQSDSILDLFTKLDEQKKLDRHKTPTVKECKNIQCATCLVTRKLGVSIYRYEDGHEILISQYCIRCARSITKALYFGTFGRVNLGSS